MSVNERKMETGSDTAAVNPLLIVCLSVLVSPGVPERPLILSNLVFLYAWNAKSWHRCLLLQTNNLMPSLHKQLSASVI